MKVMVFDVGGTEIKYSVMDEGLTAPMPGLCLRRRIRRSIFLTHYMLCMRRTGMK